MSVPTDAVLARVEPSDDPGVGVLATVEEADVELGTVEDTNEDSAVVFNGEETKLG